MVYSSPPVPPSSSHPSLLVFGLVFAVYTGACKKVTPEDAACRHGRAKSGYLYYQDLWHSQKDPFFEETLETYLHFCKRTIERVTRLDVVLRVLKYLKSDSFV